MSFIDILALTDFREMDEQPFLVPHLPPPYEPMFIALRARRSFNKMERRTDMGR